MPPLVAGHACVNLRGAQLIFCKCLAGSITEPNNAPREISGLIYFINYAQVLWKGMREGERGCSAGANYWKIGSCRWFYGKLFVSKMEDGQWKTPTADDRRLFKCLSLRSGQVVGCEGLRGPAQTDLWLAFESLCITKCGFDFSCSLAEPEQLLREMERNRAGRDCCHIDQLQI